MASRATYDVSTLPTEMYADGSVNEHAPFLHAYISLSGIVSEAQEKVRHSGTTVVLFTDLAHSVWVSARRRMR